MDRAERASIGAGTSVVHGGETTGTWTARDRANPTEDASEALLAAYREGVRTVGAALHLLSRQAPSQIAGHLDVRSFLKHPRITSARQIDHEWTVGHLHDMLGWT
jgi:hypothetical protein